MYKYMVCFRGTIETTNILMVCNQTAKDTFIVSDDSFNNEMVILSDSNLGVYNRSIRVILIRRNQNGGNQETYEK